MVFEIKRMLYPLPIAAPAAVNFPQSEPKLATYMRVLSPP